MTPPIDRDGWWPSAEHVASPNFDGRPESAVPDVIVIHNISLPPGEYGSDSVRQLFANTLDPAAHPYFETLRGLRVSSHFLIDREGRATQFVACGDRAWHAGVSTFEGRERCNDFSIGIELEGCDSEPFEDAQYRTLAELTAALVDRYPVVAVAGHSDIAPGRKTDPGPFFDWQRYLDSAPRQLRSFALADGRHAAR